MIASSLELKVTYQSNLAVEELENALKKEIELQQDSTQRKKSMQGNPLELGNVYLRILENGGHLGC